MRLQRAGTLLDMTSETPLPTTSGTAHIFKEEYQHQTNHEDAICEQVTRELGRTCGCHRGLRRNPLSALVLSLFGHTTFTPSLAFPKCLHGKGKGHPSLLTCLLLFALAVIKLFPPISVLSFSLPIHHQHQDTPKTLASLGFHQPNTTTPFEVS